MSPRLKPVPAPLQVASLALGCVIAFGCFILAGDFLKTAGPLGAALGITLGWLAMLVIARSYGLMVRTFPVAGAEFAYAYRAAGRHHAAICVWFLTLGYLSIVPLNATALAILGKFLAPELFARDCLSRVGGFEVFAGEVGLAAFAVDLVGFLHSRGVRGVGGTQMVMTGLMVAVVGVGAFGGRGASLANYLPWFVTGRQGVPVDGRGDPGRCWNVRGGAARHRGGPALARAALRRARLGDRRHGTGESGTGGSDPPERRRHGDLHRDQRLRHGE